MDWTSNMPFESAEEFFRAMWDEEENEALAGTDGSWSFPSNLIYYAFYPEGSEKLRQTCEAYVAWKKCTGDTAALVVVIDPVFDDGKIEWRARSFYEVENPPYVHCPKSLLDRLDEPANKKAWDWRKACGDTREWPDAAEKISRIIAFAMNEGSDRHDGENNSGWLKMNYLIPNILATWGDDDEQAEALARSCIYRWQIKLPGCEPEYRQVFDMGMSAANIENEILCAVENDPVFENTDTRLFIEDSIRMAINSLMDGIDYEFELPDGRELSVEHLKCAEILKERDIEIEQETDGPSQ